MRAVATAPAGDQGVRDVIGRRFALYPQPDRSGAEWAAWWQDYFDVLSNVPKVALEAAMLAYVRDPASEFIPKPGKLLELARHTPNQAAMTHDKLQFIADFTPPWDRPTIALAAPELRSVTPRGRPEPDAEEKARVRRMLGEFIERQPEKPKPTRDFPATHGKPDDGGLTKEMRALIARRGA